MRFEILGEICRIDRGGGDCAGPAGGDDNDGFAVSLEKRTTYVALPDVEAETQGLLRIVDESGDDTLNPKDFFYEIALPDAVKRAVLAAA